MRILMIETPLQRPVFDKARPNGGLGPAYIVGSLRQHGIEVDYIDATIGPKGTNLNESFYRRIELENGNIRYGMSLDALSEIFSKYDIVATSSIFTSQTRMHFEIASIVKKVAKESSKHILMVAGGVNSRALKEHFLSNGFDIIALADGETTIIQIVDQFSSSKPDYSKVERIAYRENGKTIITSAPSKKSTKFIDHIPHAAIDIFPTDVYKNLSNPAESPHVKGTKYAGIQTSRGCQDKCTFCHISVEKDEKETLGNIGFLRMFSEDRISEDVSQAIRMGINRLYFEDDNLFFNKKRLFKLAPSLKKDGLSYSNVNGANIRFLVKKVNNHYEVDHEFINMLADFGLDELMLPFETKSNEILQKYATGKYDPDTMNPIGIIKSLKKAGIRVRSNFLIGFKDESWESIVRTKNFVKELFNEGLDQVKFGIPVPFPGTQDFVYEMLNYDVRKDFNDNLLKYTDLMHPLERPQFQTKVSSEKLYAAVHDFSQEINSDEYVRDNLEKLI